MDVMAIDPEQGGIIFASRDRMGRPQLVHQGLWLVHARSICISVCGLVEGLQYCMLKDTK
jgi:hypothetical protein